MEHHTRPAECSKLGSLLEQFEAVERIVCFPINKKMDMTRLLFLSLLIPTLSVFAYAQQATQTDEPVRAIKAPRNPLPAEAASAGVTKFSFIVYGDTRGRRDGLELQYEHSMVVNSAVQTIKKLEKSEHPVRFVLQRYTCVA